MRSSTIMSRWMVVVGGTEMWIIGFMSWKNRRSLAEKSLVHNLFFSKPGDLKQSWSGSH